MLTFPSPWSIIGPMKIGTSCVAFLTTFLFLYTFMVTNKDLRLNFLSTPRTVRKEGVQSREHSTVTVSHQFELQCTRWLSVPGVVGCRQNARSPRSWRSVDSATSAFRWRDLCCFLGHLLRYGSSDTGWFAQRMIRAQDDSRNCCFLAHDSHNACGWFTQWMIRAQVDSHKLCYILSLTLLSRLPTLDTY